MRQSHAAALVEHVGEAASAVPCIGSMSRVRSGMWALPSPDEREQVLLSLDRLLI